MGLDASFLLKLAVAHRNPAFEAMASSVSMGGHGRLRLHRPMQIGPGVDADAQQMCHDVLDPWNQGFALLAYIQVVSLATHNSSPFVDRDPFIVHPPSVQPVHL